MPMGGPSVGGGLTGEVVQIVASVFDAAGVSLVGSNRGLEYVAPAGKWLVCSTGYQSFDRGIWYMTDDPRTGQFEEIPNVPHKDPATDWLHLVGVFRDRLVFCNRTGATYRWYQCTLDFSVWQEIGSMIPDAGAALGTVGQLSRRWAFLKDTAFGDMFIVQGSSATASQTFWYTTNLGGNWSPYDFLVSGGWQGQCSFGNLPAADGLPGNEFFMMGIRDKMVRCGQPFFNPFPGPGVDFPRVEADCVTPNQKSQFIALPDGRMLVNGGRQLQYSIDNGVSWVEIPSATFLAANFGQSADPQLFAYDEKTGDIILHQRNVTWRTADFVTWSVDRAIAAALEPTNDGTVYSWGGQQGDTILIWPEANTASVPLRSVVRL